MTDTPQNCPPLALTRLWQCTSAEGHADLTGRLGNACALVTPDRDWEGNSDATQALITSEAEGEKPTNFISVCEVLQ